MPRKQTKDQKIEELETRIRLDYQRTLDIMRERDDAKAALVAVTGAKGDDVQRLRLAALAYPQDDPKSIGWDDLASYFGQHTGDVNRIKHAISVTLKEHDISADVDSVEDMDTAIGAIDDLLKEYREASKTIAEACEVDHGGPEEVAEAVAKRVKKEGFGQSAREDAIELLRELGYDVACLLPKSDAGTMTTVALDDPHVVFTLRAQVRR